jgi:hypothetical protein
MSLGEMQQLYSVVLEIDAILKGMKTDITIIETKTPQVVSAKKEVQSTLRMMFELINVLQTAVGTGDMRKALDVMQSMVVMAHAAEMAYYAMMAAEDAATFGLTAALRLGSKMIMFATGVATTAYSLYNANQYEQMRPLE